jgi:hypothetical protein
VIERRPLVYADENFDLRVVETLRERGFDILAASEVGMLRRDDPAQLAYAASIGRVLLSFNRDDFRRLHARFQETSRRHAGIVLLPQRGPRERRVIRASMLLDWLATFEAGASPLLNWNDLQARLHRGERLAGYGEDDVRLALGVTRG